MKLRIKGKVYDCVTISTVAGYSGKSSHTLRKMEQLGTLPRANIFIDSATPIPGKQRMYTVELAQEVGKILREEVLGPTEKRSADTVAALQRAFDKEARRINNPENE